MPVKYPVKYSIGRLRSIEQRKKFGAKFGYGAGEYGTLYYGEPEEIAGIYRVRYYNGKKYHERMNFFDQKITHTAGQNAQRAKYIPAVNAWKALCNSEKAEYNRKAKSYHCYGYHLFMKEQLKA
jgi:hypothetical protein